MLTDDLIARLESVEHNVAHDELCREAARRLRELEAECSNHAWQENEQCKRAERAEATVTTITRELSERAAEYRDDSKRAEAERDALRAEVERLRGLLGEAAMWVREFDGTDSELLATINAALAGEKT